MRITKHQLQTIINEEMNREFPIHLYSKEDLMQEGLFDFLGKMWDKLAGLMEKGLDKALTSALGDYKNAAKDVDTSELDPSKPETYETVASKIVPVDFERVQGILDELSSVTKVEDWTPPLSDEDQEKALGLWGAIGWITVSLNRWKEYGLPDVSVPSDESPPDPASACEVLNKALGELLGVYEWLSNANVADGKMISSVGKYIGSVKKLVAAIAKDIQASAKEEQKEWVDLRYAIGTILAEGNQTSVKLVEQQLRKIIKEELMIESLSKSVQDLLSRDYEKASHDTRYPYGRNRGDVRSTTVYARKDGQPVPEQDLKLLQDRDAEVRERGGSMAALSGIYTTTLSQDGMSLVVKYYRHTAG